MKNHVHGKIIIVTGAASGFGRLVSQKAVAAGAKLVCADINESDLKEVVQQLTDAGGQAVGQVTDVSNLSQMKELAATAVEHYGRIDVMVNNAGVMPLAFYADHAVASDKWSQCIDVNIKGVLHGIVSVYDQMMAQEEGHVINISSIYGNFPVAGAGVYGASKAAVNFLSESLRVEARGKIKVTTVKPTGVPATGLAAGIVNPEAVVGIVGQHQTEFQSTMQSIADGQVDQKVVSQDSIGCAVLEPDYIADQVIYAINQPKGVTVGDITMRGSGDYFVL